MHERCASNGVVETASNAIHEQQVASNAASNKDASKEGGDEANDDRRKLNHKRPNDSPDVVTGVAHPANAKHQRWDRKAYNEYQRKLMQFRRALKSGRAEAFNVLDPTGIQA